MIRIAWSVLCSESFIDRDTNHLALGPILEMASIPPQSTQAGDVALAINCELVTLLYLPPGEPAGADERCRLGIIGPDGSPMPMNNDPELNMHVDIGVEALRDQGFRRLRCRTRVQNMLFRGTGWYYFVVDMLHGDEVVQSTRVPFEVSINPSA